MKHYKIIVSGLVQGVNFRRATKQKADELGVSGHVMNHANGTVLIQAEGNEDQLKLLLEWCHRGPFPAQVKDVTVHEEAITGFQGFEIRHFDF